MSICPRCQSTFSCSMADNLDIDCWCADLPPMAFSALPAGKLEMDAKCFCPLCLPIWRIEQEALKSALSPNQIP